MLHFHLENAEDHVVRDRVLVLGLLHEAVVRLDRTLLSLDILFKHFEYRGIIGRIIPAVREFEPVLRFCHRCPTQLDDTGSEQRGMSQFFGGMQGQFGDDGFLVGSPDDLGADPVLVVCEPFIGIRLVKDFHQILHIGINNLSSKCSHEVHSPKPLS